MRNQLRTLLVTACFVGFRLVAQTPADISLVFYLEERSENGTVVGTVSATDPDGNVLAYSFVSGNDLGAFAINSSSGSITVADEGLLNFDVNPTFVLQVEADDGNGGMTSVQVTINLVDIPLGLELDDKLRVYPNPTTDRVFIELLHQGGSLKEVSIYSLSGRLIPTTAILHSSSELEVNFGNLTTGIYMLNIQFQESPALTKRIFVR